MQPNSAQTELARQWLRKASHDLRAADLAADHDAQLWDIAAFHSQQAAEKALKAFLAWHDVPFRRTHNLVELLEDCEAIDPTLGSLRLTAQALTRFAVEPRYPGGSEPSAADASDALDRAREAVDLVRTRLPEEVLS